MTAKKDLKKLIRARCAKTGETFTAARQHVLTSGPGGVCPACKRPLSKRTVSVMAGVDDNSTEGQIADHLAAELSGDWGEWAMDVEEVYCANCEPPLSSLVRSALGSTRPVRRRK